MRVAIDYGFTYDTRDDAERALKQYLSEGKVTKADRPRVGVTRWITAYGPRKAYIITREKPEP